jgi:hypothetical protein
VIETSTILIVPVQRAFSLFTRRSPHQPIHGFRLREESGVVEIRVLQGVTADTEKTRAVDVYAVVLQRDAEAHHLGVD